MSKQEDPSIHLPAEIRYRQTALELTRAGLTDGDRIRLSVTGNSMAPLMRPGDAVWAEPARPASLQRGDLVVVRREDDLVTHRLVAVDDEGWYTKGDNFSYLDPPVDAGAILGRVVAIERNGARIELQGRRWAAVNRCLGLIGWWEACLFRVSRRVKRRLFGVGHWPATDALARLVAVPFCGFIRLLLRYAGS